MKKGIEQKAAETELLEAFREEMGRFVEEEKRAGKTAHFEGVDFNPGEFTLDDARIWEEVKNGTVTRESLKTYTRLLVDDKDSPRPGIPLGRLRFLGLVRNKATAIFIKRELGED